MTNCELCSLSKTRTNIVRGSGHIPAEVLLIGEAPGVSEDIIGEPFVGKSGELLNTMIHESGICPTDCYFTHIVMCRPMDTKRNNREPTNEEILACRKNVLDTAEKVWPLFVVFIGKIAERYYRPFFKYHVTILAPSFLLKSGGKKSPWYRENVIKLQSLRRQING
jgi:DNA polymerase